MCIICVQLQQDKLTAREARRNFYEMVGEISQDHHRAVADLIEEVWAEEEREKFKYESHTED